MNENFNLIEKKFKHNFLLDENLISVLQEHTYCLPFPHNLKTMKDIQGQCIIQLNNPKTGTAC